MNTLLTDREARVLGVLIEKHLSTPDHYPLSINAAKNACNQKSNRDPVVSYAESEVQEAVDSLHRKQLVGRSISSGSRTTKYRHSLGEALRLQRPELAVLSPLLLRGPQTVGEIRTRTKRMYEFESLEAAAATIDSLIEREDPLLILLSRQPGQKEARYAHLLCGTPDERGSGDPGVSDLGVSDSSDSDSSDSDSSDSDSRNSGFRKTAAGVSSPTVGSRQAKSALSASDEIAELRSRMDALESAFAAFRKQFE